MCKKFLHTSGIKYLFKGMRVKAGRRSDLGSCRVKHAEGRNPFALNNKEELDAASLFVPTGKE